MSLQLDRGTRGVDATDALAAASIAAWRWEIGSAVVEWSPGASLDLGVPDIVLQSPELLREAIDPDDLGLVSRAAASWREGEPIRAQVRVHIDGTVRWFEVAGRVVVSIDARPHYATGTVREVTDAREAQDALVVALRESEEALELLRECNADRAVRAPRRVA